MRTAYIVDSVPELVNRSLSSPNRSWKRSATAVAVGDGVTNRVPVSSSACVTFCTITGFRCPSSIAPKPIDRSSSRRPSTSVSHAPRADAIEIGYGSQCWKDDVTPSGSERLARTLCSAEAGVEAAKRSHSPASSAATRSGSSGVDEEGKVRQVAGSCAGQVVGVPVDEASGLMGYRSRVVVSVCIALIV